MAEAVGQLTTRGLRQAGTTSANAAVLFRYPDGSPTILHIPLGRGAVYYSAAALEDADYGRLLEALFQEAGVDRPVRVRPAEGGTTREVEARFGQLGNRKLLYIVNSGNQPAPLRVEPARWTCRGLRELRVGLDTSCDGIVVPGQQTSIVELLSCEDKP